MTRTEQLYVRELPHGLTLLGQPMDHVASASMALLTPAGACWEPRGREGAATIAVEWMMRGAGDRDSRALNDALDALGCQHQESARSRHMLFEAVQLGRNLPDVLGLYADILRRPRLEDRTFGPARDLALQDLASLEDEPARKCMVLLRERFYPSPLGRSPYGTRDSLRAMSPGMVRRHHEARVGPAGTILSIAGNIDWDALCDLVEELFGDWQAVEPPPLKTRPAAGGTHTVRKSTAQTHLGLAYPSVTIRDEDYYAARLAETMLSGGMSGRLFTEVREKRGLAYHVAAHYESIKDHAGVLAYAGTRPDLAQETFDVTVAELRRLGDGFEPEELARARTQVRSALVMQGESTGARASALASDWYHLGRLRTLDEISGAIRNVPDEQVRAHLHRCPPRPLTVLVMGPAGIDLRSARE